MTLPLVSTGTEYCAQETEGIFKAIHFQLPFYPHLDTPSWYITLLFDFAHPRLPHPTKSTLHNLETLSPFPVRLRSSLQADAVSLSNLEHQLRFQRPLNVEVQLRLGNSLDVLFQLPSYLRSHGEHQASVSTLTSLHVTVYACAIAAPPFIAET